MDSIIGNNLPAIIELCKIYRISRLYAFGSVLGKNFSQQKSDIDMIIELEEMPVLERGENILDFWDAAERIFNKHVDLLTDQPIKNPFLKSEIDNTKKLIYDGSKQKVFV
jgi:uncharacterized protein